MPESTPHQTPEAASDEPILATGGYDMSEMFRTLGKLEERLASTPSGTKQFWSSFGGAGAVAGIVLTVLAIFLPRELDQIRSDFKSISGKVDPLIKTTEGISSKSDEILSEMRKMKDAFAPQFEQINMLTARVDRLNQDAVRRLSLLRAAKREIENRPEYSLVARHFREGDADGMARALAQLPQQDKDNLFSLIAAQVLMGTIVGPPMALGAESGIDPSEP